MRCADGLRGLARVQVLTVRDEASAARPRIEIARGATKSGDRQPKNARCRSATVDARIETGGLRV